MKAPPEAEFLTPDQIAETMSGITVDTYKELWGVMNKLPEVTQEQIEDGMTPGDYRQIHCVMQVWDHLSEVAQQNIVDAIETERHEEYWRRAAE